MMLLPFQEFAQEGLRTLCLAVKDISNTEYTTWAKKFKEARFVYSLLETLLWTFIDSTVNTPLTVLPLNLKPVFTRLSINQNPLYIYLFTYKLFLGIGIPFQQNFMSGPDGFQFRAVSLYMIWLVCLKLIDIPDKLKIRIFMSA